MISQSSEYALRAMALLLASDPPELRASQELAVRAKVPVDYMAKVLNCLCKSGLVISQRGRNGGCKAAKPATQISVLDVINAMDGIQRIESCPLGIPSHERLCELHRRIDDAARAVEEIFASTTMAELIADKSHKGPLGVNRDFENAFHVCR